MAADRQQYTMFSFQMQDPKTISTQNNNQNDQDQENIQNQTIFMKWNTKPNPNYKLKYYNYFSEFVGNDFDIRTYNKYTRNHKPFLQYYMRFSQTLFPEEIEKNKNSVYNTFFSDPSESEIVTEPYTGRYSLQPDFHFFRRN